MNLYRTPPFLTPEITSLCGRLAPGVKPVYVPQAQFAIGAAGQCEANVEQAIRFRGGRALHGWNIRLWPRVLLHARPHVIHSTAEGALVDVTPGDQPDDEGVLFLSGPAGGDAFEPLARDPDVEEFIALAAGEAGARNEWSFLRLTADSGDLRAETAVRQAELARQLGWRYASKDGPCPCGSGRRYGRCCSGRRRPG